MTKLIQASLALLLLLAAGCESIQRAAVSGDIKSVQQSINRGVPVDQLDENGQTALHLAAANGRLQVATYLVQRGANVNLTNKQGLTPLILALSSSSSDSDQVALMLIQAGADPKAVDAQGNTPLYWAVQKGSVQLTAALIHKGADVNAGSNDGKTPLFLAVTEDKLQIAMLLLNNQAQVKTSKLPLVASALAHGRLDLARLLITHGADPTILDANGESSLGYAARLDDPQMLAELLQRQDVKDKLVNVPDNGGRALLLAVGGGNIKCTEMLLETKILKRSPNLAVLYVVAAHGGRSAAQVAQLLMEYGANPNLRVQNMTAAQIAMRRQDLDLAKMLFEYQVTPMLHRAVIAGDTAKIHLLLDRGCDVNMANIEGTTPICIAIQTNKIAILNLLIDAGGDVKTTWEALRASPLHWAAYYGNLEAAQILVAHGADVNAITLSLQTPLSLAMTENRANVVDFLQSKGARSVSTLVETNTDDWRYDRAILAIQNKEAAKLTELLKTSPALAKMADANGLTLLHWAAASRNVEAVRALLANGADINATTIRGTTPLHWACLTVNIDIVKELLDRGALLNTSTDGGWTCLHFAAYSGNCDVARLLLARGRIEDRIDPARGKSRKDCQRTRKPGVQLASELKNAPNHATLSAC